MTKKDVMYSEESIIFCGDLRIHFIGADFLLTDDLSGELGESCKCDKILKACLKDFKFGTDFAMLDKFNRVDNLIIKERKTDVPKKGDVFAALKDSVEHIKNSGVKFVHFPWIYIDGARLEDVIVEAYSGLKVVVIIHGAPAQKMKEGFAFDDANWVWDDVYRKPLYCGDGYVGSLPGGLNGDASVLFCEWDGEELYFSDVTEELTSMDCMFSESSIRSVKGFINTSSVKTLAGLFSGCSKLTGVQDFVKQFSTSSVESIALCFADCESLKELDLTSWDVSSVSEADEVFQGCKSLVSLNLSGWDTKHFTDISRMFKDCSSLEKLDLTGWDLSGLTESPVGVFDGCSSLKEVITDCSLIKKLFEESKGGLTTMEVF